MPGPRATRAGALARAFAEAAHRARRRRPDAPAAPRTSARGRIRAAVRHTPRAGAGSPPRVFCSLRRHPARRDNARGARRHRRCDARSHRGPAASSRWLRHHRHVVCRRRRHTAWSAPSRTARNPPRPRQSAGGRRRGDAGLRAAAGAAAHGGGGGRGRGAARAHRPHPRAGHSRVPGARDAARRQMPDSLRRLGALAGTAGDREPRGRRRWPPSSTRSRADTATRDADARAVPDLGSAYLHDRRQTRDHRRAAAVRRRSMCSRISRPRRPRSRAKRRCCAIPN